MNIYEFIKRFDDCLAQPDADVNSFNSDKIRGLLQLRILNYIIDFDQQETFLNRVLPNPALNYACMIIEENGKYRFSRYNAASKDWNEEKLRTYKKDFVCYNDCEEILFTEDTYNGTLIHERALREQTIFLYIRNSLDTLNILCDEYENNKNDIVAEKIFKELVRVMGGCTFSETGSAFDNTFNSILSVIFKTDFSLLQKLSKIILYSSKIRNKFNKFCKSFMRNQAIRSVLFRLWLFTVNDISNISDKEFTIYCKLLTSVHVVNRFFRDKFDVLAAAYCIFGKRFIGFLKKDASMQKRVTSIWYSLDDIQNFCCTGIHKQFLNAIIKAKVNHVSPIYISKILDDSVTEIAVLEDLPFIVNGYKTEYDSTNEEHFDEVIRCVRNQILEKFKPDESVRLSTNKVNNLMALFKPYLNDKYLASIIVGVILTMDVFCEMSVKDVLKYKNVTFSTIFGPIITALETNCTSSKHRKKYIYNILQSVLERKVTLV